MTGQPSDPPDRELAPTSERLETERPIPRLAFRGGLRRSLMAELEGVVGRPDRLGLMVAAYSGSGLALLLVVGLGLAGVGPLAAG